ncbi:MAG: acyl-CoA dehydrogenase family protein [Candidatus Omnitrophica bacterium]|nr:acyl-CoA dehydrogenase family protein [Candidatus Omnitrophota bacterium]
MSLYDKNISEEKKASLEFAEQSRETEWKHPSFALQIFHGKVDWPLIHPFPAQPDEDKRKGDAFLQKLEAFLKSSLDPNAVDQTGIIPDSVIKGLADLGAFAIKIPKKYGGLEMSQVNYSRAIHLAASYCGSTAVLLSAHQSIGVPQPLKLFGTEEQKAKYLPMFAKGAISAFALTEAQAGSDPRRMTTTATPTEDGKHFLINGEKLWCTNGPIAKVIVVMAVTPPKIVHGKDHKQITAFIVETDTPGFETVHRCMFMGLRGIQNGLLRFTNVKVPKENIILGEGEGLKLALMTLNTGRLTLPAASTGISKWCLGVVRQWSLERRQWGTSIGEHESIALKLGYIASHTFAQDALGWLTCAMADDKDKDIRLEAAIAKYFCTRHSWRIADETLQIRGGQGYETQASLKARGQHDWPVERVLRDVRINLIIEGTSEIMRLFIAREALDPHLDKIKAFLSPKTSVTEKLTAAFHASRYYFLWYPRTWMPFETRLPEMDARLNPHNAYIQRTSRRLARTIFHAMLRHQKKLESKQAILNRVVDIGVELFVMAACCAWAGYLIKNKPQQDNAFDLADLYCRTAQERVEGLFRSSHNNHDRQTLGVANKLLAKEYEWLENDIVKQT